MADGRNYVVPGPRDGKNAGARFWWRNGLVPRLEGSDSMTFKVKDDHCRRAVFCFCAFLVVSDSVLRRRQFRLQLGFSIVSELRFTSITDEPNLGITDFHSRRNGPGKQSHEKQSHSHKTRTFHGSVRLRAAKRRSSGFRLPTLLGLGAARSEFCDALTLGLGPVPDNHCGSSRELVLDS